MLLACALWVGIGRRSQRGHQRGRSRRSELGLSGWYTDTARKEIARDAVEVVEVAKASLDHGEQTLAIARKRAPRLASIEGCKLLRQQPSCLRLVIVRVGDEMDLDAPLVAAHCGTRADND